ncbi:MAG TPA: hypothetical protein VGB84_06375 [Arachidicoccus sp.]
MTHYSLIWYFGYYHAANKWSVSQSWRITAVGVPLLIIFAYSIQMALDTPVRKYFTGKRNNMFKYTQDAQNN